MKGVFLSYRRDDTSDDAKRIYARLSDRFGKDLVYIDVEDIPLGVDFMEHITRALQEVTYVLIAIGPKWLIVTDDEGRKRLDDPEDPVRYEIRTALENKRLVVPMLVGGAEMPEKQDLPKEIAPLVRHNGIAIRPDPDFEADVAELMKGLHLDRIDAQQVPMVFNVRRMANDMGIGGTVGWGLGGAGLGILSLETQGLAGLISLLLSGLLVGYLGGAFVGLLTALLVRHKSPPLVSKKVRRMGVTWSVGLILSVAAMAAIGVFVGMNAWNESIDSSDTFGDALAAIFMGLIVMAVIVFLFVVLGLIVGSSLLATYFARKMRMRSEEISRVRAWLIGLVWLFGGLATGVMFALLFGLIAETLK